MTINLYALTSYVTLNSSIFFPRESEQRLVNINTMDLRSRGATSANDVREDILLETNFDDDGVLTLAHATNHSSAHRSRITNTENPLLQRNNFNTRRSFYRSDTSIDRYSEYSLHGRRQPG